MRGLLLPQAEQPRRMLWPQSVDEHEYVAEIEWWEPATVSHGGRPNTPVVQSSDGFRYVFDSRGVYVGMVEHPAAPAAFLAPEFWPLYSGVRNERWLEAATIRASGCAVAWVDGITGVAAPAAAPERRAWRLAYACVLLGFYPPMGLELPPTAEAFTTGVIAIGDRPARTVKRAVLARLVHERWHLRRRAKLIEEAWR